MLEFTKQIKIKENPTMEQKINEHYMHLKEIREKHILLDPIDILTPDQEELMNELNKNIIVEKPVLINSIQNSTSNYSEVIKQFDDFKFNIEGDVYSGFRKDSEFKKILIVSHASNISKMIEIIMKCKGLLVYEKSMINNCSLTVVRIYCSNCGGVCKINHNDENINSNIMFNTPKVLNLNEEVSFKKFNQCNIEFDFILYNNVSHLEILK